MRLLDRVRSRKNLLTLLGLLAVAWCVNSTEPSRGELSFAGHYGLRPVGYPQLVSVQPLASSLEARQGAECPWIPVSGGTTLAGALASASAADLPGGAALDRAPLRVLRDDYPNFSAVAVDTNTNEVYLQDENLFGYKVYNRLENTPPTAKFSEPKRIVQGSETKMEFNCALYVDPGNGDVYSVNNDTMDTMAVFPRDAQGNVAPMRELHTPHGTYGIAIDEQSQELFLTAEHENSVLAYPKTAHGDDKPLRTISGDHTGLADPHGIGLDTKNQWIFVSNHGNTKDSAGVGHFVPPSITVYALKANGDAAPLRTIEGPKAQLDWPAHIYVDSDHGELFVANDVGDSVLVFRETDNGDVAPQRIIKGQQTGIRNPTGIYVDKKNSELWVSNMGNHQAVVFSRDANGNVPPLRTIRSAPVDIPSLAIGNPGAVAYDTKREEILVPNCVAHPQLAAFPRLAKQNSKPSRLLAGQKTLLSRTMHDVRYDDIHDEIFVANPFAEAILVFRAGASGEEAPIRIIQGPHTQLQGTGAAAGGADRLEVDPVHDEIFIPAGDRILVYSRTATGDTAPLRVIAGPETKMKRVQAAAVDPVHNVIVVGTNRAYQDGVGALLMFNRTDNGNVKPQAIIMGPKAAIGNVNQIQVYPPKGWIVVAQSGDSYGIPEPEGVFVGVWSIHDSGDVAPHWKLTGPKSTIKTPRGVALNPKNKELIVADRSLNAVLTFYFPEIF